MLRAFQACALLRWQQIDINIIRVTGCTKFLVLPLTILFLFFASFLSIFFPFLLYSFSCLSLCCSPPFSSWFEIFYFSFISFVVARKRKMCLWTDRNWWCHKTEDRYRYEYCHAVFVSFLACNQLVDVHKLTLVSLLINADSCIFQIITYIKAYWILSRWPSRTNFRNILEIIRSHEYMRYEFLDRVISSGCCDIQAASLLVCIDTCTPPPPTLCIIE